MYELILASASPRRKMLLEKAGYFFSVHTVKVSENIEENLNSEAVVSELSRRKALSFLNQYNSMNLQQKIVLAADTMVCFEGVLLGKPENSDQALAYLKSLSGKKHSVMTAMTFVLDGDKASAQTVIEKTEVEFFQLNEQVIRSYVATGEPMDKAGAYAIQGQGRKLVRNINGSWSNVVGLPLEKLEEWINESGFDVRKSTI